jgi:hypothetical protein
MKRWILFGFGLVLLGTGAWWLNREVIPAAHSLAWEDTSDEKLKLQLNQVEVFQRAFWRRPSEQDQIVHAERRHWVDIDTDGVEKWQWFIEVKPGADFTAWLLTTNPFDLELVSSVSPKVDLSTPPDWMPAGENLAKLVHYRKRGGDFHVFHDLAQNRLFATDNGGGFTLAKK